jgi:phenylpyruvate tautomerase PptA (4-oxalocrotonate tautomerase family)
MVFVRVHVIKGHLSAAQEDELGAKLIQAVSDVEGLVNNERHKETSWVQFYEFEPEDWYAPANLAGSSPDSRIQLEVVAPQKLLSTPEDARAMLGKADEAVPTRAYGSARSNHGGRPARRGDGCRCGSRPGLPRTIPTRCSISTPPEYSA